MADDEPTVVVCSPQSWGPAHVPSTSETCANCGAAIWLSEDAVPEPGWKLWCFACAFPSMDLSKPPEPAPWVSDELVTPEEREQVQRNLQWLRRMTVKQ